MSEGSTENPKPKKMDKNILAKNEDGDFIHFLSK